MARKANTDGAAGAGTTGRLKQIAQTYKQTTAHTGAPHMSEPIVSRFYEGGTCSHTYYDGTIKTGQIQTPKTGGVKLQRAVGL